MTYHVQFSFGLIWIQINDFCHVFWSVVLVFFLDFPKPICRRGIPWWNLGLSLAPGIYFFCLNIKNINQASNRNPTSCGRRRYKEKPFVFVITFGIKRTKYLNQSVTFLLQFGLMAPRSSDRRSQSKVHCNFDSRLSIF